MLTYVEKGEQPHHVGAGLGSGQPGLGAATDCLTQVVADVLLTINDFTERQCQTGCSVTHEPREKQDHSVMMCDRKT